MHLTTFQTTDPELVALMNHFVLNEVPDYSQLDARLASMLTLASLIATQSLSQYKITAKSALTIGLTPVEIKEVLYQTIPYLGIAKTLDFLTATNEVLDEQGIKLPLAGQSTTTLETRQEKGLAVQKAVFGNAIDTMYEKSPKDQLHIQKLLSANCFGDYYTRTGLDLKTRELLTFSILISLGGVEPQVRAHVQGCLNMGADKELLINVTTQLLPYIGYPRTLNAIKAINEVIPD